MKTTNLTLLLLLFLLAPSPNTHAQAPSSEFAANWNAANQAYQSKDYPAAQNILQKMIQEETQNPNTPAHPDLYYNLGNTYYQQGQYGHAAHMYEKTLALSPRHHDARQNLTLIRTTQGTLPPPTPFLLKPIVGLYTYLTASEWTTLFLTAYFAATLLAALLLLLPPNTPARRHIKILTLAATLLTLLTAAFLIPRYHQAENKHYAIVIPPTATVRSAPGPQEEKYFEVLQSQRLEITQTNLEGWLKVKHPGDGRIGYLPENTLRPI